MKHIYVIALAAALIMPFTACSDFLDREPLTQPEASSFLSTEAQVENYVNGLYTALPSFKTYGMGVRGEEKNSDNIIAQEYDHRLHGTLQIGDAAEDWQNGYKNLRNVNYFFEYYRISEDQESAIARSLRGEVLFLRAYWHFDLLKKFGAIPVMDTFWDGNATLQGLQIPAKPRNEVARFILQDLENAAALLFPRNGNEEGGNYAGLRINREAAKVLAMNVALYEGTWEKYHADDAFKSSVNESNFFLEEVIRIGDDLFENSGIDLYTKGNDAADPGNSYAKLFNSVDLTQMDEVLLWRKYSEASGVYHSMNAQLKSGYVDEKGAAGISRSLVNNYLNADGTFINPNDPKFHSFIEEFKGRDPRLLQTVMHEGAKWASATTSRPMHLEVYTEESSKMISTPRLVGDGASRSLTGYHIRMGIDTTYVQGNGETALPLIRYAEALLDYAEAAAELEKFDQTVYAKTIGKLRSRAGVADTYPFQRDIYTFNNYYGYTVSEEIHEIRRERRSELALQGFRLDDLMRWKADKLIVGQQGRGAYIASDGILFQSFSPQDQRVIREQLKSDDAGFANPMSSTLPNGYGFNPQRDYLLPIPPSELELNKELKQNPKW